LEYVNMIFTINFFVQIIFLKYDQNKLH